MAERQPTSHERRAGAPWDDSYRDGPPPWDIGRPQPAIVRLAAAGGFSGAVLDAGCGTGENALHVAALGLPVFGVDVAETAVAMAKEKSARRGVQAEFAVADAFELVSLGRTFDTVLDVGLFHTFEDGERRRYLASLAAVTEPGARLHVLCFREAGADSGPHPVTEDELRAAFGPGSGWELGALAEDVIETTFAADGIRAWLATVVRT